ncbi:MAG: BRCT domain-containing protein [Prevotellaceae bacterium]|jgi:NAD-dependent DNA ligase|nr:BRCT domain-containing protein [Prevotellaceae bacterium]
MANESIFYKKTCVIAGIFEDYYPREKLALKLKSLGARVTRNLSKKTDFFIVGEFSGLIKMHTALQLISEGNNLKIMHEHELINEFSKLKSY